MLVHLGKLYHGGKGSVAEEYLPLAVDYVFLKIIGQPLRGAEILLGIRYFDPHFGTELEEGVYSAFGCEYDGRIVRNVNLLSPEFPYGKGNHAEERPEVYLHIVFFHQIGVVRIGTCHARLGYEYLVYFHNNNLNNRAAGSSSRLQRYKM